MWRIALSVLLTNSPASGATCDSVLNVDADTYVGCHQNRGMAELDGRAEEWASCLHQRTMGKLAGNVGVRRMIEALHDSLEQRYVAWESLEFIQCDCNGAGHLVTWDRPAFERDFARLVDAYVAGGASENSPRLKGRIARLREAIELRLSSPSAWDVGYRRITGQDTREAASEWRTAAEPIVHDVRRYAEMQRTEASGDSAVVMRLEIVAGQMQRLLGGPDSRRAEVERARKRIPAASKRR